MGDKLTATLDLRYHGYLEDILDIDFESFKVVYLRWGGTYCCCKVMKGRLLIMPMNLPWLILIGTSQIQPYVLPS